MNTSTDNIHWSENVIIADADYLDHVAFNLIVNFERMLNRRLPKADLSTWLVDIALDGGLRPGNHETQVVLVHDAGSRQLDNFAPADYASELSAQAFRDERLGEFSINSYAVEELTTKDTFMADIVDTVIRQPAVQRIMIIPDCEQGESFERISRVLRNADDDKRITVFAMQPLAGGNFRQEILGYSLMHALGVKGEEIGK